MEKIKINVLNETIYHEVLENGLDIYIYKKAGFQKKLAYFQTKYGALNNEFIPIGENKMKKYPLGIAHFLEHKLFESDDNSNAFEKFEKNGAYVNAMTSYDRTVYFFNAADYFYENLGLLIDMVQSPYFTDENVEKEKGIIGQEIDMYANNPEQAIFEKLFYNTVINNPLKYDICGTKEEVSRITKEELYECYNTFYHPSNMFLFIAGDLDEKEVIDFVRENQNKKTFEKAKPIVNKEYKEPEEVAKQEETIYHNVTTDKFGYAYKILLPKLPNEEDFIRRFYVKAFLASRFGGTTNFTEDLIKNKYVKSYLYYDYQFSDDILIISFSGDVLNDKKVYEIINDKLRDFNDLEELFELYKKNYVSNYVKTFESLDSIQSALRSMINKYGVIFDDVINLYKNASYDKYMKFLKSLNFDNVSKIIVKKEDN